MKINKDIDKRHRKRRMETDKETDYKKTEKEEISFFWFVAASQMCSDPLDFTFSLMWSREMYLYPCLAYYTAISLVPANMRLLKLTVILKLKR